MVIFGHLDQALPNDLFLSLSQPNSQVNISLYLLSKMWQSWWQWRYNVIGNGLILNTLCHVLNLNLVEVYYLGKKNDQFTEVENWKVWMFRVYLSSMKRSLDFKKKIDQSYFLSQLLLSKTSITSNVHIVCLQHK